MDQKFTTASLKCIR